MKQGSDQAGLGGTAPPPTEARQPVFYTAAETSEILRLDESTLYRHLRKGTFPGVKIGGRYVVPRAALERLIADVVASGHCVDLARWGEQWLANRGVPAAAGGALSTYSGSQRPDATAGGVA